MQHLEIHPGKMPTALMTFSTSDWEDLGRLVDAGRVARDASLPAEVQPLDVYANVTDNTVDVALTKAVTDKTPDHITTRWSEYQLQALGTTILFGLLVQGRGTRGEHFAPYETLKDAERQLRRIRPLSRSVSWAKK